jgi:hypothetical protein
MEENTLKRIKKYIDYKGISVSLLEKETGMSNGSFASQLKKNKTIGVDKLENILKKYSEINPSWLLTGKGTMLKGESSQTPAVPSLEVAQPKSHSHCQFETSCEMKKSEALFLNANALLKEVKEVREFQRKYIRLLESYNTMTVLFAKAHMKLLHLFYYARQHKDAAKSVDLKVAEQILHDMDEVEAKLQHA